MVKKSVLFPFNREERKEKKISHRFFITLLPHTSHFPAYSPLTLLMAENVIVTVKNNKVVLLNNLEQATHIGRLGVVLGGGKNRMVHNYELPVSIRLGRGLVQEVDLSLQHGGSHGVDKLFSVIRRGFVLQVHVVRQTTAAYMFTYGRIDLLTVR